MNDFLTIRDVTEKDEHAWRRLWKAYGDFYQTEFRDVVTYATWHRIMDPKKPHVNAIVAELDGRIVAIANYIVHEHTWDVMPRCYLNDLYVDESVRGQDIGGSLIRFLQERALKEHWGRIYWLTHETNDRARRLYDRFAPASGFIQYAIPPADPEDEHA